ncbi:MAG: ABC transporter permease [Flexilinea sp.]
MNNMRSKFSDFYIRNKATIFSYIVMFGVLILFIVSQPNFFSPYGIKSFFDQLQPLSYAALAQTMVILTGGVDLSIGAAIGLTNSIAATIMVPIANSVGSELSGILITIVLVLLTGALIGLFNGLFIVKGHMQPMVVTLATSFIFTGAALFIRPLPGGEVFKTFLKLSKTIPGTKIPMSLIWLLIAIFCIWLPVRRSRFGQAVYAIGGNEASAYVSGINVERVKLKVYVFSGLMCAIAGLILTAYNASGDATGSTSVTMNAVAASVLGGTALIGGRGGYYGTVAGTIIYALVLGLLIFWGVNAFYQNMFKGLILIFAVAINVIDKVKFGKKVSAK